MPKRLAGRFTPQALIASIVLQGLFAFIPAAPARAAIADGANAIDVLGQYDADITSTPTPIYTKNGTNDSPNRLGLNLGPTATSVVDAVNHRLFVSDYGNHRVLVFNLTTGNILVDRVPDFVLGQANFNGGTGATTQVGMSQPGAMAYDSGNDRLFVANYGANRVTVYDVASITNGEAAVSVLGQANFTSGGSAATQSGMNGPRGLAYDAANNRLFVSEESNHRVLVFNVASITDGEAAVNVLGQSNFTNATSATSQSRLKFPGGLAYDSAGTRLFVAEEGNHRVLVFNVASITDGEDAVNVLGQSNFGSGSGATTQSRMDGAIAVAYNSASTTLYVAQRSSHRVTTYEVSSISDGEDAVSVLGQPDFTSTTGATTQSGMVIVSGAAFDTTTARLYVADGDSNNHRVAVFDVAAITDGENAVDLIGQYDADGTNPFVPTPIYTKGGSHNSPNRLGFGSSFAPYSFAIDGPGNRLFVADSGNNRVLVYNLNANDTLIDRTPDFVLGQSSFNNKVFGTTQAGMGEPTGLTYDATSTRLFVADQSNNRVLVYDVSSISNGENAVAVLGQPDFTSSGGGTTQSSLSNPMGVAYDWLTQYLYVADFSNGRIMVFNLANGLANGLAASYVVGQADFTSTSFTASQTVISAPRGIAYSTPDKRLFVPDGNNRVMIFDTSATTTTGMAAANVLGQTSFTATGSGTTASTMSGPQAAVYESAGKRLFVADTFNHRVLEFDLAATTDGESATHVIGQSNFTSSTFSSTTQSGLANPKGLAYDATNNRLYVAGGSRITVYDAVAAAVAAAPAASAPSGGATGATPSSTPTVKLTGPAGIALGGGSVAHGDPLDLFWQRTGDAQISVYRILMSVDAGITYTQVATETMPTDGYLKLVDWSAVPKTAAAKATVKIEAVGVSGSPVASDASDAPFSITLGGPAFVRVIRPNGGETWSGSGTEQILWAGGGADVRTYRTYWSADGGTNWIYIASGHVNNWDYWHPTNGYTTSRARFRIDALDAAGNVIGTDMSDNDWKLVSTIPVASTPPVAPLIPTVKPEVPPPPPPDTTAPKLLAVAAVSKASKSADIVWDTDEPSTTVVEYGTKIPYDTKVTLPGLVSSHKVNLNALPSDTTFHFKVTSTDAAGNTASSADQTFKTTPPIGKSTCPTSGNNVTIRTDCYFAPGEYVFTGTFTNNATITAGGDPATGKGVVITADHIINNVVITADAQGYGRFDGPGRARDGVSGAGHGGYGGIRSGGLAGGPAYGSIRQPLLLGSGGSEAGGGAIKLVAKGRLTLNGGSRISASGKAPNSIYGIGTGAGGGAGGSIWLQADTLSIITATVAADGGSGGSGAGGRIAFYYRVDTSNAGKIVTAAGGVGAAPGSQIGGAGTIYLKQTTDRNGVFIVENGLYGQDYAKAPVADTPPMEASETYDQVIIRDGSRYVLPKGFTMTIAPGGSFNASDNTLNRTAAFDIMEGGTFNAPSAALTLRDIAVGHYGTIGVVTDLTVGGQQHNQEQRFRSYPTGTFSAGLRNLTVGASTCERAPCGGTFERHGTARLVMTGTLTVTNGGVLTHAGNVDKRRNVLDVKAADIVVMSGGRIDATGKGFTAGNGPGRGETTGKIGSAAGYGGDGGVSLSPGAPQIGGKAYGSVFLPGDLGSGGGKTDATDPKLTNGNGGGAIRLTATGTLTMNGSISANAALTDAGTGAGSGGSVLIMARRVTGTLLTNNDTNNFNTLISASGWVSANDGAGGGRVAIYYVNDAVGQLANHIGTNGSLNYGGAGTVYLKAVPSLDAIAGLPSYVTNTEPVMPQTVKIVASNHGEHYLSTQVAPVAWSANGDLIRNVQVSVAYGGRTVQLFDRQPLSGSIDWKIPVVTARTLAVFKARAFDADGNLLAADTSDTAFMIIPTGSTSTAAPVPVPVSQDETFNASEAPGSVQGGDLSVSGPFARTYSDRRPTAQTPQVTYPRQAFRNVTVRFSGRYAIPDGSTTTVTGKLIGNYYYGIIDILKGGTLVLPKVAPAVGPKIVTP